MNDCTRRTASVTRSAFTLIELLVVVAIIMMLAGLLFPAFNHVREMAKKTKAKTEVKQLETAWRAVLSDYRGWSAIGAVPAGRDMDSAAVGFLQGGNSKGVIYMEFDASSTNSAGAFVDPWYHATRAPNNTYRVALGAAGLITPPHGQVSREVGAWSKGKDGAENTADDVKSWD